MTYFITTVRHLASGRLSDRRLLATSADDAARRTIELIVGPQAMAEHDAAPRYEVVKVA